MRVLRGYIDLNTRNCGSTRIYAGIVAILHARVSFFRTNQLIFLIKKKQRKRGFFIIILKRDKRTSLFFHIIEKE